MVMSRVIIHPSVKNEYLKKLINKTKNLKLALDVIIIQK